MTESEVTKVDPLICPLCQQENHCVNLGAADVGKTCWCNDPSINFPKALLDQVPEDKKRKACICQKCAEKFKQNQGVKTYQP